MINKYIDYTNLKNTASDADITNLCEEAKEYQFRSVCVPPDKVQLAVAHLAGTNVRVGTVVGFPFGYQTSKVKLFEAVDASLNGAVEIDVVLNVQKLKDGDKEYLVKELSNLKKGIKNRVLKVIIETSLLNEDEKRLACEVVNESGVDFVKTSTGFTEKGATVEDVELLRTLVNEKVGVKASGGISTYAEAKALLDAGANRLGTSKGVAIYEEFLAQEPHSEVKQEVVSGHEHHDHEGHEEHHVDEVEGVQNEHEGHHDQEGDQDHVFNGEVGEGLQDLSSTPDETAVFEPTYLDKEEQGDAVLEGEETPVVDEEEEVNKDENLGGFEDYSYETVELNNEKIDEVPEEENDEKKKD